MASATTPTRSPARRRRRSPETDHRSSGSTMSASSSSWRRESRRRARSSAARPASCSMPSIVALAASIGPRSSCAVSVSAVSSDDVAPAEVLDREQPASSSLTGRPPGRARRPRGAEGRRGASMTTTAPPASISSGSSEEVTDENVEARRAGRSPGPRCGDRTQSIPATGPDPPGGHEDRIASVDEPRGRAASPKSRWSPRTISRSASSRVRACATRAPRTAAFRIVSRSAIE